MRHPTWFYIVISACALGLTGAAFQFVGAYRAATHFIPANIGSAIDTQTGEQCLTDWTSAMAYRCMPLKGQHR